MDSHKFVGTAAVADLEGGVRGVHPPPPASYMQTHCQYYLQYCITIDLLYR